MTFGRLVVGAFWAASFFLGVIVLYFRIILPLIALLAGTPNAIDSKEFLAAFLLLSGWATGFLLGLRELTSILLFSILLATGVIVSWQVHWEIVPLTFIFDLNLAAVIVGNCLAKPWLARTKPDDHSNSTR